jgi:hypothetical protein
MINTTPEKQKPSPISYKDLIVWQKSIEFAILVIDHAEKLSQSKRHFRLIEQLEAAVTSIPMMSRGQGKKLNKRISAFFDDCTRITVRDYDLIGDISVERLGFTRGLSIA